MFKAYDNASGMQLVGMVVTTCCQTNVPKPKKRHQAHCCNVRFVVEKATLPNSTIIELTDIRLNWLDT